MSWTHFRRRNLKWVNASTRLAGRAFSWLIIDVKGSGHSGKWCDPWSLVLKKKRKQAKQAMRTNVPPWPCFESLTWLPWLIDYRLSEQINPVLSKWLLILVCYHSHRNPNWDSYFSPQSLKIFTQPDLKLQFQTSSILLCFYQWFKYNIKKKRNQTLKSWE